MISRRSFAAGLGAIAVAPLSSGRALAQAPREIVIGALYPMSGPNAGAGEDADRAFKTAMEIVDGDYDLDLPLARLTYLPGIKDARIKVVFADHQDSAARAHAEADRLINQEKAVALIGAARAEAAAAASLVANNHGVAFLDADSLAPELSQRNLNNYFRPAPHNGIYASLVGEFAASVVRSKIGNLNTIAMALDLDANDSVRLATFTQTELKNRGFRTISDIGFSGASKSFANEAGRIARIKPDLLICIGNAAHVAGLMTSLEEAKVSTNIVFLPNRSAERRQVFERLGAGAQNVFVPSGFAGDQTAKKPSIAAINTLYRSLAKRDLDDFSAQQFTAFLTLVAAIEDSGTALPRDIIQKLGTIQFNGFATIMPWRQISFDGTGQNTGAQVVMVQKINGRVVTVFPNDRAMDKLVWRGA
jgi:branched-chain amino acid transport system substrate-binding protein